jgi:hypothetical protein
MACKFKKIGINEYNHSLGKELEAALKKLANGAQQCLWGS